MMYTIVGERQREAGDGREDTGFGLNPPPSPNSTHSCDLVIDWSEGIHITLPCKVTHHMIFSLCSGLYSQLL